RLNIPSYNWWNEALHGIGRNGIATIFPQSIGLGATFDKNALFTVGHITSIEGRIKYNLAQEQNDHSIYKGLTFWEPNINIYRDPRWGRGHETYGEDPYLTAVLGENAIRGLQDGEDDKYFKGAACVKHFAVHSGPEEGRHGFDSVVSDFDLNDTYLPAFKWCIERSDVESVMGAYNMINGIPCCASPLIKNLVREKWHFKGYFVSDCGALADMHEYCLYTHTAIESAAAALKAGCDLNCGVVYLNVLQAYNDGKVTENDIDEAVTNLLATRIKLGLLDENCSYNSQKDILKVECEEHLQKSYEIATKSIVMLKNEVLPLKKSELKTIGVIGPNATSTIALEGNYNGIASTYHTVLDGIKESCENITNSENGIRVLYAKGCHLYKGGEENSGNDRGSGFSEAVSVALNSDAVIMVMGLDSTIEGEQGDASNEYGAGDKLTLSFPGLQQELMKKIKATGKKLILVVLAGGALDLNWAKENADAILYGWYPGVMGGKAIADIIFGDQNPSGKTPVTFYKSLDDLPDFTDYSMEG
ncbi:MAG: glycoside hydrolase family 3 C-terminal domain-containing protein, partial [Oscillospiraceae bacterium]